MVLHRRWSSLHVHDAHTRAGGRHTVPQIFIGDRHIGGSDDLHALDRAGGLDPLLAAD